MKNRALFLWLYICCFMVLAMAVIGAITRLTESGLSIVEWRPVTGWIPPFSHEAWQHQYDLYRQTPEFRLRHNWMELGDFKAIFFWEWLHRALGRLIGLVYAVPLLWFWARKRIPQGFGWLFAVILALGGLQSAVGWWMVKSGLVDNPAVSHYRLATHLGLALLIFSLLWWTLLKLRGSSTIPQASLSRLKLHACLGLVLLVFTLVWGAFTAGLDAGLIYNTFPLMNDNLYPDSHFNISNILADRGWVQFTHRWLAMTTGLIVFTLGVRLRDVLLAGMVLIQISLGIGTLLSQVWIPLAALHQAGAIILLALLLRTLYRIASGYQGGVVPGDAAG
jgi:heme a synthase